MSTVINATNSKVIDDLELNARRCDLAAKTLESDEFQMIRERVEAQTTAIGKSWFVHLGSLGSFNGYRAHVYIADFHPKRPGEHFDSHWGPDRSLATLEGDGPNMTTIMSTIMSLSAPDFRICQSLLQPLKMFSAFSSRSGMKSYRLWTRYWPRTTTTACVNTAKRSTNCVLIFRLTTTFDG